MITKLSIVKSGCCNIMSGYRNIIWMFYSFLSHPWERSHKYFTVKQGTALLESTRRYIPIMEMSPKRFHSRTFPELKEVPKCIGLFFPVGSNVSLKVVCTICMMCTEKMHYR